MPKVSVAIILCVIPNDILVDNLTYGTGWEVEKGNEGICNKYEVPANGTIMSQTEHQESKYCYDDTRSTYTTPNVYEYAMQGPNEKVIYCGSSALFSIFLVENGSPIRQCQ